MQQVVVSVKALIKRDNTFLLLRERLHKGDVWDLPGGKIQYGESVEQALKREIQEELDLKINIIKLAGIWHFISLHHKQHVVCITYICEVEGDLKIDTSKNPADENFTDMKWLTVDEILSINDPSITESLKMLLKSIA